MVAQSAQKLIAQQALQQTLAKINSALPSAAAASASAAASSSLPYVHKENCRIYVGALHYDLREAQIKELFSSFGEIAQMELSMDPITNRSKGFCFIEFSTPAAAMAAQAMVFLYIIHIFFYNLMYFKMLVDLISIAKIKFSFPRFSLVFSSIYFIPPLSFVDVYILFVLYIFILN